MPFDGNDVRVVLYFCPILFTYIYAPLYCSYENKNREAFASLFLVRRYSRNELPAGLQPCGELLFCPNVLTVL